MKKIIHFAVAVLFLTNTLQAQTVDSCQSETFLRTLGNAGNLEIGLTLCASGDGNLYASGIQGNQTMLLKVSPTGKALWSRSLALASQQPCLVNEMIVDSDGMLVVAGLERAGSTNPGAECPGPTHANHANHANRSRNRFTKHDVGSAIAQRPVPTGDSPHRRIAHGPNVCAGTLISSATFAFQ